LSQSIRKQPGEYTSPDFYAQFASANAGAKMNFAAAKMSLGGGLSRRKEFVR